MSRCSVQQQDHGPGLRRLRNVGRLSRLGKCHQRRRLVVELNQAIPSQKQQGVRIVWLGCVPAQLQHPGDLLKADAILTRLVHFLKIARRRQRWVGRRGRESRKR